jgi:hypothetical protein
MFYIPQSANSGSKRMSDFGKRKIKGICATNVHLLVKMFLAAPIVLADAIAVGINVRGWQITRS